MGHFRFLSLVKLMYRITEDILVVRDPCHVHVFRFHHCETHENGSQGWVDSWVCWEPSGSAVAGCVVDIRALSATLMCCCALNSVGHCLIRG